MKIKWDLSNIIWAFCAIAMISTFAYLFSVRDNLIKNTRYKSYLDIAYQGEITSLNKAKESLSISIINGKTNYDLLIPASANLKDFLDLAEIGDFVKKRKGTSALHLVKKDESKHQFHYPNEGIYYLHDLDLYSIE